MPTEKHHQQLWLCLAVKLEAALLQKAALEAAEAAMPTEKQHHWLCSETSPEMKPEAEVNQQLAIPLRLKAEAVEASMASRANRLPVLRSGLKTRSGVFEAVPVRVLTGSLL